MPTPCSGLHNLRTPASAWLPDNRIDVPREWAGIALDVVQEPTAVLALRNPPYFAESTRLTVHS